MCYIMRSSAAACAVPVSPTRFQNLSTYIRLLMTHDKEERKKRTITPLGVITGEPLDLKAAQVTHVIAAT